MEQFLLDQTFPGSDNSWKVRLWQDYENKVELCTTKWLDRPGINDWEAGSSVQWKSKMDNPSENYFGTFTAKFPNLISCLSKMRKV